VTEASEHSIISARASHPLERRVIGKVWRRIVPLLALALLCAYLDRVNIGFAALQMNEDLGLTNTTFGFAAGVFAIGYALFAIPSALMLHRFGARRWLAFIAVVWGVCSAATAFVSSAPALYVVRFLLGAAEAGFAPGAILCFTIWFPSAYRGRVLASFLLISPLGFLLGGPLSSVLLSFDGLYGFAGWQWLFVVEAAPTLLLAIALLRWLPDAPARVGWLKDEEKAWLEGTLAAERQAITKARPDAGTVRGAFADLRVWLLVAVNLAAGTAGIGATMFLPLIVQSMGFSTWDAGFVVTLPALAGGASLLVWGILSDRAGNRSLVIAIACTMLASALLAAAFLLPSAWAIAALCLAMAGYNGAVVALWTLPNAFLTGAGAAVGVAIVNIAGHLGAFTGPVLLGAIADGAHSYATGLIGLAASAAFAICLALVLGGLVRAPAGPRAPPEAAH
jgi:MFS transporter, ACS family, tartrate transporter